MTKFWQLTWKAKNCRVYRNSGGMRWARGIETIPIPIRKSIKARMRIRSRLGREVKWDYNDTHARFRHMMKGANPNLISHIFYAEGITD